MAKTLAEIVSFCKIQLDLDVRSHINETDWSALTSITDFLNIHAGRVLKELGGKAQDMHKCPRCSYSAFEHLSSESSSCHVCGYAETQSRCLFFGQMVDSNDGRIARVRGPDDLDVREFICETCIDIEFNE